MQRFGGLVNLNVHFHLLVPDGVFVEDDDWLAFALHPVPTSADVVAIIDRIVRRIARRIADETRDDRVEEGVDVLAQVQAEAAATWRSPHIGKPTVRGVERLRAWCEGISLRAGVTITPDPEPTPPGPAEVYAALWIGALLVASGELSDPRSRNSLRSTSSGTHPRPRRREIDDVAAMKRGLAAERGVVDSSMPARNCASR